MTPPRGFLEISRKPCAGGAPNFFSVTKIWFRKFWHHSPVGRSHRWPPVATGGSVALYKAKILTCSNFDKNWHSSQFLDVEHDKIIHFSWKSFSGSLNGFFAMSVFIKGLLSCSVGPLKLSLRFSSFGYHLVSWRAITGPNFKPGGQTNPEISRGGAYAPPPYPYRWSLRGRPTKG